jgi:predicted nucleotidyltransferase component of viral defense system
MNLHLDPSAFETLILEQSERTRLRSDVIEKDYYVSLILHELSEKQKNENLPAYFKGGTALYKALKRIQRFSEDIDLTVFVEDCPNNSQKQKVLEAATKRFTSLTRNQVDPANITDQGSITTIYNYDSVVTVDKNDTLQRFGRVKIEGTSFTISEPHTALDIAPVIFENATLE